MMDIKNTKIMVRERVTCNFERACAGLAKQKKPP
jgi:hypothetical protein